MGVRVESTRIEDAILEQAQRESADLDPSATFVAIREMYADRFVAEVGDAFELAAVMMGDQPLADFCAVAHVGNQAVEEVIDRLEHLPQEIERLDRENQAKATKIEELEGQIESRKQTIRSELGKVGRLDRLFNVDVEARVENGIRYDDRIKEIEEELKTVRSNKHDVFMKLAQYRRVHRPLVERVVERVAAKVPELYDVLEPKSSSLAMQRLERRESLVRHIQSQLDLLEELKQAAEDLGAELESVLAVLRTLLAKAIALLSTSEPDRPSGPTGFVSDWQSPSSPP